MHSFKFGRIFSVLVDFHGLQVWIHFGRAWPKSLVGRYGYTLLIAREGSRWVGIGHKARA